MTRREPNPRGFTLIELIAVMLVLGIAAGAVTPLLISLTDTARAARNRYAAIDTLHHAIDRTARLLREAPPGAGGGIELTEATPTSFTLPDGRGISLVGDTIQLDPGDGSTWPLADAVSSLAFVYLQSDGTTTTNDPAQTQRVAIRIERDTMTLTTVVYFRTAEATP